MRVQPLTQATGPCMDEDPLRRFRFFAILVVITTGRPRTSRDAEEERQTKRRTDGIASMGTRNVRERDTRDYADDATCRRTETRSGI